MVEGICYHKTRRAIEYIDQFIRYSVENKTNTHLRYLGYKEVGYKDEVKFILGNSTKQPFDIAQNDLYLVEFIFQYGSEPVERRQLFYIPYMSKGNMIRISDKNFLAMPTLADKVVSVGDKIIFINILTAKYSFSRYYYSIIVDNEFHSVPLIVTELYKNQSKKQESTTKAYSTVMHYLLANYGYTTTMKSLLGFVPKVVYDYEGNDKIVITNTGNIPRQYIKPRELYQRSNIKFLVDKKDYNETVAYTIGNILYIIDNFPDMIRIDNLDDTFMWKRLLAEIIHSGNYTLDYLMEKISAHFNDINSKFDTIIYNKLLDIGVRADNLVGLLLEIFRNFNNWIMAEDPRSLYHNKTFEVESYILSEITSRITKAVLDINKEELRIGSQELEKSEVDKIFKNHLKPKAIYRIKQNKQFITSIEYCGDHLYPKNSAMVVVQESDFKNTDNKSNMSVDKKKIVASMATIGSILGLSKKDPNPLVRLNPYVNVDYKTGTVLPHPEYNPIIEETDKVLTNMIVADVDLDENAIYDSALLDSDIYEEVDDVDFGDDIMESIDVD